MSYSVKVKRRSSLHLVQSGEDGAPGMELVLESLGKNSLYLWLGSEGDFNDEPSSFDWQAIYLTYQDAELLVHLLQEKMKEIKDI